jgi:post-segregation antitoxin (ccd killing protein)
MSEEREDVTVQLPARLLAEARAHGVDVAGLTERALADAVLEARRRQFAAENREGIEAFNERIAREGPSLLRFRSFRWRSSTCTRRPWPISRLSTFNRIC